MFGILCIPALKKGGGLCFYQIKAVYLLNIDKADI